MTNEISVPGLFGDLEAWRLGFNPKYEQRVQESAVAGDPHQPANIMGTE
jgi:hypothetical protein